MEECWEPDGDNHPDTYIRAFLIFDRTARTRSKFWTVREKSFLIFKTRDWTHSRFWTVQFFCPKRAWTTTIVPSVKIGQHGQNFENELLDILPFSLQLPCCKYFKMSVDERSNSLNDDNDVIIRASDIKIRDVSWFNRTYGADFTFVKDLFTKQSFSEIRRIQINNK